MNELMAQGIAQEEEEPLNHDAKTESSPQQKSVKDTWALMGGKPGTF